MQQVINDSRRASPMVFMACCRNCWIFLISHSDPALPPCHHSLPLSLDEMLVWVLKNCVVAIELPGGRGGRGGCNNTSRREAFLWTNFSLQFSVITFYICYWFCCYVPFPNAVITVLIHSSGRITRNVMLCGIRPCNENKAVLLTHRIFNYKGLCCVTGN